MKIVFESIKLARPPRLYVASDGARLGVAGEGLVVDEVRSYILDNIDWPCSVKTLFREFNLGCGRGVSEGVSWFFENEEMGIILEDDTVPDQSFYQFCQELLEKYKDDERVGVICGTNHLPSYNCENSYLFSKFKWMWGWATWRRCWENYDHELQDLDSDFGGSLIANMGYTKKSVRRWKRDIGRLRSQKVDTWDYQWFLSLNAQYQLSIFPATNLVANIGFGENATHTKGQSLAEYTNVTPLEFPLQHPEFIVPRMEFETRYEKVIIKDTVLWKRLIPQPIKRLIKKILNYTP